ncbi:biotin transport system ATP-binding protein [Rhodobacter sp. JA431]|uniref:energy-coupling factor ABC transporter ATP-binding protein n=1 Tax=Rhodobacter sp. JA431 TaxID=570013 RepID=UPI000BD62973|nr:ABC transporter ATP-binding protein [Rhodobacter sp. JA431]SOC17281.1 biotin transport system ATP-binding protein [Rhodobacter sp. JA431]
MIRSSVGHMFPRLHGAAGSVSVPSLPAAPGIEIAEVSHRFGDTEVLRNVSVTLTERRIAIVGANGSGKSTFSRLLNGLLVPERGRVTVDGHDTASAAKAVRRKVGFVFQNPDNQIVFPTVAEDVAFGLKGQKLSADERAERVGEILARYGLEHLRDRPAHKLSGGQKQLLALAGVLITRPDYVVFDEPTTLLDLRNARMVGQVINTLAQTAIVVTHDLPLIEAFDRVLVFDQGRIIADDVPSKALSEYVRRMQ